MIKREFCGGDVDQQAVGFHVLRQPAEPLKIDAQLIAAGQRADIQFGNCPRADHAVSLQRVVGLKTFTASTSSPS